EARALLAERLKAIAPLMKGPFHREHLRELVAFSSRPTLGSERAEQVVAELTPGKPLYLRGYLTQSVKSLDFKRRDSTLGYETTRIPDLKFRLAGSTAEPWRLPVYSKLSGDALEAVGVVEVDLLPDPATTAYDSHLAYLPALHFARWLLELPDGEHELELATNGSVTLDVDKPGAYGRLKVSMNRGSRTALKAYYDALWAKKLAAVVYPDAFGVTDLKGQIPNADHLAKYGTLLKLTCAETNKVMKPFPNQTQVDNYVGQGFGLFERDGRYEIIALSFSRKPSEAGLRFTALRGIPDDYTLAGPTQFGPTLVEFGYEIPKANLSKTGSW
ncbi:MAG: hypothetical protein KDD82_01205, partial [Planctomycetes bacterium]|nr:hypothetical protein [Planctomycetota bacterium]